MLALSLSAAVKQVERVLAIGCHADDIEIGCGGTLLALTRSRPTLHVTWVVLAAAGVRAEEARESASAFLADATHADIRVLEFRESFLPYIGGDVKEAFEALKEVEPDLILTHTRHDLHQDHRLACELTWNTFRDHLILEYEIPKYDGDLGAPNVFVPLSEDLARKKGRLIREAFSSQRGKHWFGEDVFLGLMRLRGVEAASASGYAEAFVCRKLSLLPSEA
jgi:LmbE family N-acetylglucosaminyl deacetylase